MNADTMSILEKLNTCFIFRDATYLFRDEQVTDHCKRTILRFLFIQIDNILELAGRAKNELLKEGLITKTDEKQIKQLIKVLAKSYNYAYAPIRDKIAAHNQPIDLILLLNLWNDIDQSSIAILYRDTKNIQTAFATVKGFQFQSIPDYSQQSIPNNSPISLALNLVPSLSSDRLGLSKPNTVSMIACHPSQEKAQTICSIIDFLKIDFALTVVTNNPTTNYQKCLFNIGWLLAMIDICSLIDNLFSDNKYDQSLLLYWKSENMAGYESLFNCEKNRDITIEEKIRNIRNTLGAHLDKSRKLSDIFAQFESIDLGSVHRYACHLVNSFEGACHQDIRTRIFCIQNEPLDGIISVQNNGYKPFKS